MNINFHKYVTENITHFIQITTSSISEYEEKFIFWAFYEHHI